jgi:pimeloyl-ACP methyl ester carboxylesterase
MAEPILVTETESPSLREFTRFVRTRDGQDLALVEVMRGARPESSPRPTFLLLHGFAQNRRTFTLGRMPELLLDRGARVFIGELRGHGDSRVASDATWTMDDHLDFDTPTLISNTCETAGVERIHFVGHSMGGLLGCALLSRKPPFASMTAAATPIMLGASRPLVRLAALALGPFATFAPRPRRVPMDFFLRTLASPLANADARGVVRALQRITRLANPSMAVPDAVREILAHADPESPAVMEELAKNAVLVRPRLCDVDLVDAVQEAECPIAAIVGSRDIFAPRAAIAPLESKGQRGPREVVEIEGATHIDAVMGHHLEATIDRLWPFWMQNERASS